jgi:hypothetical protein
MADPLSGDTGTDIEEPSEDEQPHGSRKRRRHESEEDCVELLDDAEALEFVEFDPSMDPKDSWQPPQPLAAFLHKHLTVHYQVKSGRQL